jgi:hypothetical protein
VQRRRLIFTWASVLAQNHPVTQLQRVASATHRLLFQCDAPHTRGFAPLEALSFLRQRGGLRNCRFQYHFRVLADSHDLPGRDPLYTAVVVFCARSLREQIAMGDQHARCRLWLGKQPCHRTVTESEPTTPLLPRHLRAIDDNLTRFLRTLGHLLDRVVFLHHPGNTP